MADEKASLAVSPMNIDEKARIDFSQSVETVILPAVFFASSAAQSSADCS